MKARKAKIIKAVAVDAQNQKMLKIMNDNSVWYERQQPVVIDGKHSNWLPVTSGIPQGSLLGPALFVLFINDMPSAVSDNTTFALFADDAKCFRTMRSSLDCAQFQRDIDTLVEWSYAWKLAFNFDKCSLCTVTKKRNQQFTITK